MPTIRVKVVLTQKYPLTDFWKSSSDQIFIGSLFCFIYVQTKICRSQMKTLNSFFVCLFHCSTSVYFWHKGNFLWNIWSQETRLVSWLYSNVEKNGFIGIKMFYLFAATAAEMLQCKAGREFPKCLRRLESLCFLKWVAESAFMQKSFLIIVRHSSGRKLIWEDFLFCFI